MGIAKIFSGVASAGGLPLYIHFMESLHEQARIAREVNNSFRKSTTAAIHAARYSRLYLSMFSDICGTVSGVPGFVAQLEPYLFDMHPPHAACTGVA